MPLPTTKAELLESLQKAHSQLDQELSRVSRDQERIKEIQGGLSCCDLLAYQIGWGQLLLGWDKAERLGQDAILPAEGFKWNQLGALAESFYQRESQRSLAELRSDWQETVDQIEAWIESLTTEEIFEPCIRKWAGQNWPIIKWIQVNSIAPYQSARTKLRRWLKSCS